MWAPDVRQPGVATLSTRRRTWRRRDRDLVVVLLVLSALALLVAPGLMPPSYSWVSHTTSESAGQGVTSAWVARTGFLGFGTAVLLLARRWHGLGRWLHVAFGVCMIAAAIYSSRPWTSAPFDHIEDLLHSVAATAMGFAFAGGVLANTWSRVTAAGRVLILDTVALLASVAAPLAMMVWPDAAGLLQRGMFAVAFLWYGRAAGAPMH